MVPYNERIYVSVNEACQILGVKRTKLYEMLDSGKVDSRKEGRRRLIVVASLH